jgi:hypothetical protein
LLGTDPEKLPELRRSLADLIETGGSDPKFYTSLVEGLQAQKKRGQNVERCRKLGIAVQEAIKAAMETYKLKLTLVDRGFDYEVALSNDGEIEDVAVQFLIGTYLLEVKATTTGKARLTPLQANTASNKANQFVLCVVDLRNLSDDELDSDWTASRVEPLAKIVPGIGTKIEGTFSLVEIAKTKPVAIRNELALRYEVPSPEWDNGMAISEWVKSISGQK